MAWDHLSINKPHLVYIILGGFTSLFMLCSSFIKERMYIGEATVATLCGVIFGPHAANLIDPSTWGNTDQITLEFSRIVLVVQCFAVGVELPKYYMEKHWRSVVFLLIPVMTFGWLITSLFIWWLIPPLDWLQALCCAACVTATDPILASSVVGKGKFAKRIPKHLRDLLSAESGCNDGMAFPFVYLALYLIEYDKGASHVSKNWIVVTILYECVFGAIYGFIIGFAGRHGIKWAEKNELVDRESFLVFYFVLALFCAGSGSLLGVDDLLVGFAAGVGFSNDGWFTQKTEESHVSNVIDLLLNLAYFVYLGTIIPWAQYNDAALGTSAWRLVVISIFVILFRRIPIMLALKPLIPDIKTWREALFAGHFGPIGVGAIFVAILARAELETDSTTPLAVINPDLKEYGLVSLIWPITTFLVISSILVHGSSIAVFTLGKHINTLTLTMSYTTANEDGPSWMNRLPRIQSVSKSMGKSSQAGDTDTESPEDFPPGTLPPVGIPRNFLRRQKEEDEKGNMRSEHRRSSSLMPRRRKKKWDDGLGPGGPISASAIAPQRLTSSVQPSEKTLTPEQSQSEETGHPEERDLGEIQDDPEMHEIMHRGEDRPPDQHKSDAERHPEITEVYIEGDNIIIENADGDIIGQRKSPKHEDIKKAELKDNVEHPTHMGIHLRKKLGLWMGKDEAENAPESSKTKAAERKRGPALAYQFGNTIIVEDADGEVVKKYDLPSARRQEKQDGASGKEKEGAGPSREGEIRKGLTRMGTWAGLHSKDSAPAQDGENKKKREELEQEDDDKHIRFTIGGAGQRMTKEDFLQAMRSLDPKAREAVVAGSSASTAMKVLAKKDASTESSGSNRLFNTTNVQMGSSQETAKQVGAKMAERRGAHPESSGDENSGSDDDELQQMAKRPSVARLATPGPPRSSSSASDSQSQEGGRPSSRPLAKVESATVVEPETAAERRRREQALKGVEDDDGDAEKGETPAERRRRKAALGTPDDAGTNDDDSEDDDTPRVPKSSPSRPGVRFAAEPVKKM